MAEFRMPSLGSDMEAGVLRAWRCAPGDRLRRGDIIAEVETEKGIIEVEIFDEGVVTELLVTPGTKVPVGTPLATLSDAASTASSTASKAVKPDDNAVDVPPPKPARPAPPSTPSARRLALERGVPIDSIHGTGRHGTVTRPDVEAAAPRRVRASPRARARAKELGLSLQGVEPTGPGGEIVTADIERSRHSVVAAPPDGAAAMRRAIGAAMARSKREIPHYYVSHTIDLGPALVRLRALNETRAIDRRAVPGVLLLRAVVLALQRFPELNALFEDGCAVAREAIHLGVAVSLRGGGLIAPAIRDAHKLSLDELMEAFRELVARAREGRVRAAELSSSTVTVTSLGERGVEAVFPVIVPPQVAIVGFGTIVERPFVVDGNVVPRPVVHATLAADHRASDGHRGSLFLAAVDAALKDPNKL